MILLRNLTRYKVPRRFLANAKKLFLRLKIPKDIEISVVFATPALMRKLNRRYRKKDKATNVLAFGPNPRERRAIFRAGRGMLGEVFISPAIAKSEARKLAITFHQQLTRLLVHAILHIMGYNHAREKDARLMEQKESALLEKLSYKERPARNPNSKP